MRILRVVGVIMLSAPLIVAIVVFILAGETRVDDFLGRISNSWWVRAAGVLAAIVGMCSIWAWIRKGYDYPWTGFGEEGTEPNAREARPRKTLWDWMQLGGTLAIPIAIAFFGTWFTAQQAHQTQKIENQRAEAEQKLANQSALDERIRAYLEQMSTLYLNEDLSDNKVRILIRSRTLTVLESLGKDGPHLEQGPRYKRIEHGPRRKRIVMMFLSEAALFDKVDQLCYDPVVKLNEANLNHADLNYMDLTNACLPFVYLKGANLDHAHLENAELAGAHLENAYLGGAYLSDAHLNTTHLSGADLNHADLRDARMWTEEQLRAAKSLKGATMPDGQTLRGPDTPNGPTFEEWLKDQEARREDAKNQ